MGDKPIPSWLRPGLHIYPDEVGEEEGPVAPLPPPPAKADTVVPADVREAWKVYDTMLIASLGDRHVADQEFERVRERRITKRGRHGKDTKQSGEG